MEKSANEDIISQKSTNLNPEDRNGSSKSSTTHKQSLEFRAEIIPFDTSEEANAPILAFSGDSINLIFSIPKEKFRMLAAAALDRLEQSDSKPPEKSSDKGDKHKSSTSTNLLQSDLQDPEKPTDKSKSAGTIHTIGQSEFKPPEKNSYDKDKTDKRKSFRSRLSDVVKDLEGDNTSDIINAYQDDVSRYSNDNVSILKSYEEYHDEALLNIKSSSHVNESQMQTEMERSEKTCHLKSSSIASKAEFLKHLNLTAVEILPSHDNEQKNDENNSSLEGDSPVQSKNYEDVENEVTEIEGSNTKIGLTSECSLSREYSQTEEVDNADNLPDCSTGHGCEDSPESQVLWPNIPPYTKIKKIPFEVETFEKSDGSEIKLVKLEVSNEVIVIRITSSSSILVEAVKYGGIDAKIKTESSEMLDYETSDKSLAAESTIKEVNKSALNDKGSIQTDSTEQEFFSKASSSQTSTAGNENVKSAPISETIDFQFEVNSSEDELSDEVGECDIFKDRELARSIGLKIEEQFNKLDMDIPGDSPIERLKFALNHGLKGAYKDREETCESDAIPKNLHTLPSDINLLKNIMASNEFQDQENSLVGSHSVCQEYEVKLDFKPDEEDSTSSESHSIEYSTDRCGSVNVSEGKSAIEMSVASDQNLVKDSFSKADVTSSDNVTEKESLELSSDTNDSCIDAALNVPYIPESEVKEISNQSESIVECKLTDLPEKTAIPSNFEENFASLSDTSSNTNDIQNKITQKVQENICEIEMAIESKIKEIEEHEKTLVEQTSNDTFYSEKTVLDRVNADETITEKSENFYEASKNDLGEISEDEYNRADKILIQRESGVFQSSFAESMDPGNENSETETSDDTESVKEDAENIDVITDCVDVILKETSNPVENETSTKAFPKRFEGECLEQNSECIEDSTLEIDAEKIPEDSFASNMDSFIHSTVNENGESASESGDLESDVKSIASESDDSKDDEKRTSKCKGVSRKKYSADEIDCAPSRKTRKMASGLSKDAIPEDVEVKSSKTSNARSATLNPTSKNSGKTSPVGRSLRSKSLDPVLQPKVIHDKKHISYVESEEVTRRTRAKTPDIISRKDIKTPAKSSPRKLARATTTETSVSKGQSTRASSVDTQSKSRATLDSSISTSKRSKRGSKD